MAGVKASKTNATTRIHDPRPKSELVVECFRKANGALGLVRHYEPINRESLG